MSRTKTDEGGTSMDGNMRLQGELGKSADDLLGHGGRIDAATRLYPSAPGPWIDLSTGINPIAWPVPQIAIARYQRLPLKREISEVTAAAADFYGLPANAEIVPVPGSEIAIRLLPRLLPPGRVGILTPTYGSHIAAWREAGAEVLELTELPDPKDGGLENFVVVNPNNPDGRLLPCAELASFAKIWTGAGRRLIVDEAFAEVAEGASLLATPELPVGVVVLRSLGKFFGLAGLRVGFVVVARSDASAWHHLLGDWPVSGPACEISTSALRDRAWITATRARLAMDRKRLNRTLEQTGFRVLGGTDLFGLFESPDESDWLDHFARAGILVRAFAAAPRHYRLGLPADDVAWQRLEAACRAAASPARRPNTAQSVMPRPAR
jgi:cobalamin biosynthetic protein CobC